MNGIHMLYYKLVEKLDSYLEIFFFKITVKNIFSISPGKLGGI